MTMTPEDSIRLRVLKRLCSQLTRQKRALKVGLPNIDFVLAGLGPLRLYLTTILQKRLQRRIDPNDFHFPKPSLQSGAHIPSEGVR